MALHTTCDGFQRRDFLKAGALGAGLSLAGYLRLSAEEGAKVKQRATAKSAIFINLAGGPSHMDTFDLKPEAPDDHRGAFKPIDSNVSGIKISEHLPKLARQCDKFAILRSVTHTLAAHDLGSQYVNTGNRPLASLEYPGIGSVVAKEISGPGDLPSFVAVPNTPQRPGFLGVQYSSLNTGNTPIPGQPYGVRGIALGNGLTVADVEKRQRLLADLDTTFRDFETRNPLLDGLDRFGRQAYEIITSKRAREAFDVSKESPAYAKQFGTTGFGMSCLLATRLIGAGVPFVTVNYGGWDTHYQNWDRLKTNQLPPFDEGLAALFSGLAEKGLLDSTVVMVTGEFGRTPKINPERNGRDHYPRAMFMLMAGGGICGGQVYGTTDAKATEPASDAVSPDDVATTFYHCLGIDHTKEYHTSSGRPIMIVRDGHRVDKLLA